MPPAGMHYDTDVLRKICDIWEKHGSGLIAFHGQSGDIMFQGANDRQGAERLRRAQRTRLRPRRRRPGGAHLDVLRRRGALRAVLLRRGQARTAQVLNTFLDDIHRPALPYKFKFKFSGCPNDCMNSIQRSDMAVIGTWRDNIRTDEALARKWFAKHGMNELVNDVDQRAARPRPSCSRRSKDVAKGDAHLQRRGQRHAGARDRQPATACAACTAST